MTRNPRTELEAGVRILEPVLTPHGFVFAFRGEGNDYNDYWATGEFFRDDRSLFLDHHLERTNIGYQIGDVLIYHEEYMKLLGIENQSDVLGMRLETGANRYRALHSDLERFCSSFLFGPSDDWRSAAIVARQPRLVREREHEAWSAGDVRKREQAHDFFRQKRYADVIANLELLRYPDLMTRSETWMLEIARNKVRNT